MPSADEIEKLLPAALGSTPMLVEAVGSDARLPPAYDRAVGEKIAQRLGIAAPELQVAVARPAPGFEAELPPDWQIVAIGYPVGRSVEVVGAYLAEMMLRPGTRTSLSTRWELDRRDLLLGEPWSIGWVEAAVFVITFDWSAYRDGVEARQLPNPLDALQLTAEAVLPVSSEPTAPPHATPSPTAPSRPETTPGRDLALERTLPTTVSGIGLEIHSAGPLTDHDLQSIESGLHGVFLHHFDLPARHASVAVASPPRSTFSIWAHRVDGLIGDDLMMAMLGEMYAGVLGRGGGQAFRSEEVAGRRYLISDSFALFAEDEVLYWMLYFDFGDCFSDECAEEVRRRAPLEDIVRDAVAAIP